MTPYHYILRDKIPVAVGDLDTWGKWMEDYEKRIVMQEFINDLFISTVFLGLDHNFMMKGPPILFETMVFWMYEKPIIKNFGDFVMPIDREPIDELTRRYSTWDEAEAGHKEAVVEARMKFISVANRD